ncbi:MAG: hypothetical protein ACREDF_05385, partial [Thermoplasmata archaeon]
MTRMERLVWVGGVPRKDKGAVRAVVAAALEAGFDQIVRSTPDDSLQRLGRVSPIVLESDAFSFDGEVIGRLVPV